MSSTSEQPPQSKAFALLAAIVAGDTAIEDVIAELRSQGVDSVEATVNTLRQGVKQRKQNSANVLRPVSLRRSMPTSPELVADIVQRVPKVPWTLNGVLYDPEDITRFNGQELHFIASPSGDHMMAVDDRTLIQNWWQLTYLEQYRQFGNRPGGMETSTTAFSPTQAHFQPYTIFADDINFGGDWLTVAADRGWLDLRDAGTFSDWNDIISSVHLVGTRIAVIYEHIYLGGQSFTIQAPPGVLDYGILNLVQFGWNDRASSLETW